MMPDIVFILSQQGKIIGAFETAQAAINFAKSLPVGWRVESVELV